MNQAEEYASIEAECNAEFPAVPESPTLTVLRRAYCDRLANFVRLASRVGGLGEFVPLASEVTQLGEELKAISGWVLAPLSLDEWKSQLTKTAEMLTAVCGWSFSEAHKFVKETNEARRGHPVTNTRALAIRAHDLRQTVPPVSWTTIANKICDCGEKHTHKCRERIRIATGELGKLLDTVG